MHHPCSGRPFIQICRNGFDIYKLDVGDLFVCDVYDEGLDRLKRWLLYT